MAAPGSFLDLANVSVVRGERTVLHEINLRADCGESIAILGPNGCGKSTLLKTISYELYPLALSGSHVRVLGRERWDVTALRKRLGVVQNELPGKPILRCTGFEAVLTGYFSSSTLWPHLEVSAGMREAAAEMLGRLGLEDLGARVFAELSAGQQRRLLIARALIGSGDCLLLDEPSNALDLAAQRDLRERLDGLARQGTTVVHITHHIADIPPSTQRVVLMKEGRIVADGPREELLTQDVLSDLFATRVRLSERDGYLHAW